MTALIETEEALIKAQILEALGEDPRFSPDGEAYGVLAPHLPDALVDVIGDQLDSVVDLKALCDVTAKFLVNLVESGCFNSLGAEGALVNSLYIDLAEHLGYVVDDFDEFLQSQGISADEAMHLESIGLNASTLAAYDDGTLTFRLLLSEQPGVFVPRS